MKAKKIMSFVLFLFISAFASAQKGPQEISGAILRQMEMTPSFSMGVAVNKAATRFDLLIQNPEGKKLHLKISSHGLGTVIDTVINSTNFNQRYNMEQVEDGEYSITVSDGKEKQVQKIELKTITTRNVEVIK